MNQVSGQNQWTTLAQLLRPQGRKGELLAELLTDFPERFADRTRVFLLEPEPSAQNASAQNPSRPTATKAQPFAPREITVENHWLPVGKNAGRIVLKFAGIDSINDAELLAGLRVTIPSEERAVLDEDAAYISDLIGCVVFDGVVEAGTVQDVEFPAEGGPGVPETAPLLVVLNAAGEEILIPFAKAWLRKLDVEGKRIEMTLPEGLLTLNTSPARDTE